MSVLIIALLQLAAEQTPSPPSQSEPVPQPVVRPPEPDQFPTVMAVPLPPPSLFPSVPKPTRDPGRWVSTEDYPMVSFLLEEQGTTGFRLTVDATGKVTGRTVTRSSGFSRLDDLTCKVVSRRARFAPAQDRSGTPVTAHYSQRVIWKTASDDPMPARMFGWSRPAEAKKLKLRGKVRFEATVGEDGKVQDCRKVRSSGAALLDGETCKRLRELEETSVKRDESGVAVSRQVTGWIEW